MKRAQLAQLLRRETDRVQALQQLATSAPLPPGPERPGGPFDSGCLTTYRCASEALAREDLPLPYLRSYWCFLRRWSDHESRRRLRRQDTYGYLFWGGVRAALEQALTLLGKCR